jgi:hypothetical protein
LKHGNRQDAGKEGRLLVWPRHKRGVKGGEWPFLCTIYRSTYVHLGCCRLCENPAEAQRLVGQDPGLLDARGVHFGSDAPECAPLVGPCMCYGDYWTRGR